MDTVARVITERMRSTLGKPIVIENVPGASGSIGTGRVARAAGDGYTVGVGGWSQYVANGAVYALTYDVAKDFAPVLAGLRTLMLTDLTRLESAADAAGAPWTPGRVPDWKPE
jgi:tripartite-type tricarboxylate transporter receptor subunit TctC